MDITQMSLLEKIIADVISGVIVFIVIIYNLKKRVKEGFLIPKVFLNISISCTILISIILNLLLLFFENSTFVLILNLALINFLITTSLQFFFYKSILKYLENK